MKVLNIQTWTDEFGEERLNLDKLQEYLDFIVQAVKRYDSNRYSEWHHVMPKCTDREKKYRDQGVQINGSDHFRAHMKLVECFVKGAYSRRLLTYPLNQMKYSVRLEGLTPEEYERSRKLFSESQTGSNNPACSREARMKISRSRASRKHITDGVHEKFVLNDGPLPEGWYYGQSNSHNLNSGKAQKGREFSEDSKLKMSKARSEGNRGRRWITNGVKNSFINSDEEIPEGWTLGRFVSEKTKEKLGDVSRRRILVNNGSDSKFIKVGEEIPEGYVKGGLSSPTKDKIRITNGVCNKCISSDETIPDGWWRGMTCYRTSQVI